MKYVNPDHIPKLTDETSTDATKGITMTGIEFAQATIAKDDNALPAPVSAAVYRYASQHGLTHIAAKELADTVRYDSLNRCHYFVRGGIFHGIEADGYLHT